MSWFHPIRWRRDDWYLGPLTYAHEIVRSFSPRPLAVIFGAGEDESLGDEYCYLRVSGFGHSVILRLPLIIRPHCDSSGDYDIVDDVWYGVSYSEGILGFFFGRQPDDNRAQKLAVRLNVKRNK